MSRDPYSTRDMVSDDLAGIERDALDASDISDPTNRATFVNVLIVRSLIVLTRAVADVADVLRGIRDGK